MRVGKLGLAAALALGAVLLAARPAAADAIFYYRGPHSVPTKYGGFCNISVKHFHTYKPADEKVFRHEGNTYIFIGDPVAQGWEGPKIAYYGHHKIPAAWGGGWCFIPGPHYHFYRPASSLPFRFHAGVYYWAGDYSDPWYVRNRVIYEPIFKTYYVNRYLAAPTYRRPVIYTRPPAFYRGPRVQVNVTPWTGPRVRVHAGVPVRPGVRVGVPVRPGVPMRPGVPVRPGMPGVHPGVPVRPGVPVARPGMPPVRPLPPGQVGRPGMPGRPMPPGQMGRPGAPGRPMPPGQVGRPGAPGRPMPPGQVGRPVPGRPGIGRPMPPGQVGRPGAPGRPMPPGQVGRPAPGHVGRPGMPPGQVGRPGAPGRPMPPGQVGRPPGKAPPPGRPGANPARHDQQRGPGVKGARPQVPRPGKAPPGKAPPGRRR